jgi:hypothetical protein
MNELFAHPFETIVVCQLFGILLMLAVIAERLRR